METENKQTQFMAGSRAFDIRLWLVVDLEATDDPVFPLKAAGFERRYTLNGNIESNREQVLFPLATMQKLNVLSGVLQ